MNDRPERDTTPKRAQNRPKRIPVHKRDRISFGNLDPNYHYRVVNDSDDRLQNFVEGGYEFVESGERIGDPIAGEGGAIDSRVSKPVGGGTRGYLMRIRKDWYEEDQAEKAAKIKESEQAIKPSTNQYVPDGGNRAVTDT